MSDYDWEQGAQRHTNSKRIIKWDQPSSGPGHFNNIPSNTNNNEYYERANRLNNYNNSKETHNSSSRSLARSHRYHSQARRPNENYSNISNISTSSNKNEDNFGSSDSLSFNSRYGVGNSNESLHLWDVTRRDQAWVMQIIN